MRGGSICESIDFYSQSGAPLGSVNRNMAQRFGQPREHAPRHAERGHCGQGLRRQCVEVYFEKRLARIEDRPDGPSSRTSRTEPARKATS